MKTVYRFAAIGLLSTLWISGSGQEYHVRQVITGNSGKFEFNPPFEDYVTLQNYNPVSQSTFNLGTIYTQSIQDILIDPPFAYVSAQDSIVKYNLNTLERVASVADSGVNKLGLCEGKLVVTKQYPIAANFASVRDTSDLSLVTTIEGISGDAAGIVSTQDSLYLAVNGGWMGSTGKIAVIDPNTWTLFREIDFGTNAVGIYNLYLHQDKIVSVNKTPYGVPDLGSLTVYDPFSGAYQNHVFGVTIGNGCGMNDSLIYILINNGIGSVNLNTMLIADTAIIPDPGSLVFTYIASAAFDTINDRFYVNIGDYMTPGICLVASATGDSITSFSTGISAEAIAIDYRENPTGLYPGIEDVPEALSVYPNPASDHIQVSWKRTRINRLVLRDLTGRIVTRLTLPSGDVSVQRIEIGHLPAGLYLVTAEGEKGFSVGRVIKQ